MYLLLNDVDSLDLDFLFLIFCKNPLARNKYPAAAPNNTIPAKIEKIYTI